MTGRGRPLHYISGWIEFILVTIFAVRLLWCGVDMGVDLLKKKPMKRYRREYPIHAVRVHHKARKISLGYDAKKVKTREKSSEKNSLEKNRKRMTELCNDVISELCKGEICLLKRSGEKPYTKADGFCLDAVPSWKKKQNDRWLGAQATVVNSLGQTIAVRGTDGEALKLGYDIYIPSAAEEELRGMTLSELLKFLKPKNCKLQILDNGSTFIFPSGAKERKKKTAEVIRRAAIQQGYDVKSKEKIKNE